MDFKRTFVNVPMEYLFDLLPQIRPRAFSIASNCLAHPGVVQILVAVVNYRTKLARLRRGLCSTWLSRLEPGESASVWLRTGTIKFPASKTVCIMVGPGTGVAPFRNFIAGRVLNKMDGNLLFFGCRNAMKDFYFREEWESCCEQKLMELVTAFSRDQKEKIYVQDRIVEMGQHIWELISHENANFLIAGSAKEMPTAVKNALVKCFEDFGKLSHNDAQEYLNQMEKRNRFQSETWS